MNISMMHYVRVLLLSAVLLPLLFLSETANAQNISGFKEAQTVSGGALTDLEIGQTFRYRLVWSCSFTNVPPPEGCGDFLLTDPLPAGLEFVSCSTTGDYTCVDNAGVIEIDKVGGTNGINLGDGDSAEAFITVRLSSDLTDFPGGVVPTEIDNVASIASGQPLITPATNTPVNPPENNWEISKEALIPSLPLNPALNSPVIYRIQVCPNGPAGIGTGTIPINNTVLTDTCEVGANFLSATLNGAAIVPTAPTNTCPDLQFDLGTLDPAGGCQVLDLTLEYPGSDFSEGGFVNNTATAESDEGPVDVCDAPCSNSVDQEIVPPNPDGNIAKTTRRSQLALGAISQYTIAFNLNDSNVVLNNVVVEDVFPTDITVTNIVFPEWNDPSVTATITEVPSGTVLGISPYDGTGNGSGNINDDLVAALDPSATGFRIDFIGPVPPGFQLTRNATLNFRLDTAPVPGPEFTNCVSLSADELAVSPESCVDVVVIPERADIQSIKTIPASLSPGEEFTASFALRQDFTSSAGAINPVIVECLPPELLFVSWDDVSFDFGLDDPRDPANTANDQALGVLPNIEVFAPGAAGNNCTAGGGMLRWSWSATPPAGSLQLGNAAGVANPFTFPAYPDRNGDNLSTPADSPLGEFSQISVEATLQVVPGTLAQSGLSNTSIISPESGSFECVVGSVADSQDLDGDSDTAETNCEDTENFAVISAASIGANKSVGGFPGLENIDPDNPPANANAADPGIEPAFCPDDGTDRTRAPCVAQALAGQPFNYQVRLSNDGNVPLSEYVAYDIFPYANDVGITEIQSTAPRGSTWTPELLGPVVLSTANPIVQAELDKIGDLTIPLAVRPRLEYSASINPCRDELANGPDGPWQGGLCDDDWTETPLADAATFPNGYGSVRAWRLILPFDGSAWPVGNPLDLLEEDIVIDMPMLAQVNAPASDYDNSIIEVAFNNIGHRASNDSTGGRLLAAEVRKSGIVIPEDFPVNSQGVRLGNLVWMDTNNDGIAQLGEPGIFDVTVQLWQDLAGDGPSADDILFDTQQTDAFGHYLFDDSNPDGPDGIAGNADDVRDNLGFAEGNYYVVIPDAQTGVFTASEFFSSTGAGQNPSANDDLDNDDNGVSDLTGTPITAVGGVIEGLHSATVNLTLGAEPVNEVDRDNSLTDDDDTDFFDDNASNTSVDFGFYQLRLGNHVWLDSNNDGVAGATENSKSNLRYSS